MMPWSRSITWTFKSTMIWGSMVTTTVWSSAAMNTPAENGNQRHIWGDVRGGSHFSEEDGRVGVCSSPLTLLWRLYGNGLVEPRKRDYPDQTVLLGGLDPAI